MAVTAAPLGFGVQQFFDDAGAMLSGGLIYTFIANSSTPKDTWQDPLQGALNANPITLDSAGRAVIFGVGQYRLQVFDSQGNLIDDNLGAAPDEASIAAALPVFVGDSGAGGAQGLVPAPPAGSAAEGYYLTAGGVWAPLTVVQPATPAANAAGLLYVPTRTQTTTTGALVLTDAGGNISYSNAAAGVLTITSDAAANWRIDVLTQIMVSNLVGSGNLVLTRDSGVSLRWPGSAISNADRTLAANGQCLLTHIVPNGWTVVGAGLS